MPDHRAVPRDADNTALATLGNPQRGAVKGHTLGPFADLDDRRDQRAGCGRFLRQGTGHDHRGQAGCQRRKTNPSAHVCLPQIRRECECTDARWELVMTTLPQRRFREISEERAELLQLYRSRQVPPKNAAVVEQPRRVPSTLPGCSGRCRRRPTLHTLRSRQHLAPISAAASPGVRPASTDRTVIPRGRLVCGCSTARRRARHRW